MKEIFEIGKTYIHESGKMMHIVGAVSSRTYGLCLVAENEKGEFSPVGSSEEHRIGWEDTNTWEIRMERAKISNGHIY